MKKPGRQLRPDGNSRNLSAHLVSLESGVLSLELVLIMDECVHELCAERMTLPSSVK
jgi:hypothetical protein